MRKNLLFVAVFLLFAVFACNHKCEKEGENFSKNEYLVLSTLFCQSAAEYKALCYQSFNLARLMLDRNLENSEITAKRAIITDIDETVLDNSPFETKCIMENTNYPEFWDNWVNKVDAKPVTGAVEFLNYAKNKGVEVFYITNRKEYLKDSTMKNLQKYDFPFADSEHLLMRTEESSKEKRRIIVEKEFHVALLLGDNLADFTDKYDKMSVAQRSTITDSLKKEFGKIFIVLPNPMYGDWEGAIYNYDYNASPKIKDSLRKSQLISF